MARAEHVVKGDRVWRVYKGKYKGKWHPVARIGYHVPFGYKQDPEDKYILLPIPSELEKLEEAKHFMKIGYSMRQAAEWLSEETGRYISHVGLGKRMDIEEKRGHTLRNLRVYKRRLREVIKAIERLKNNRIGITKDTEESLKYLDEDDAYGTDRS